MQDNKVLRISVTDRCNLRCIYCMPETGVKLLTHNELLSYEEIELIAKSAVQAGIKKFRITGGEPLVRKGLTILIEKLARLNPLDLALTTNGLLFSDFAPELKSAGLKRVTISLDTLRENRFEKITRRKGLPRVLSAIRIAKKINLEPVKINSVIIRGINDDEIIDFVQLAKDEGVEIRFIELMPSSGIISECKESGIWRQEFLVSGAEIKAQIEGHFGRLQSVPAPTGVAKIFELKNQAKIGLITPISEPFCNGCKRLRLSSEGILRLCLFDKSGINLKEEITQLNPEENLVRIFKQVLDQKLDWRRGDIDQITNEMFRIGG